MAKKFFSGGRHAQVMVAVTATLLMAMIGCETSDKTNEETNNFRFHLEEPVLNPKEMVVSQVLTTLDGQSWPVAAHFRLTSEKIFYGYSNEIEDETMLWARLVGKADEEWEKSYLRCNFRITNLPTAGQPCMAVAVIDYFKVMAQDTNSLPLANYLISLDKENQRKEIAHIARQLLEATLR